MSEVPGSFTGPIVWPVLVAPLRARLWFGPIIVEISYTSDSVASVIAYYNNYFRIAKNNQSKLFFRVSQDLDSARG